MCQTIGVSDQWCVGPMVCRTDGVSDQWCVGPMTCNHLTQYPTSRSAAGYGGFVTQLTRGIDPMAE